MPVVGEGDTDAAIKKPCRSCMDFKSWMRQQSKSVSNSGKEKLEITGGHDNSSASASSNAGPQANGSGEANNSEDHLSEPLWGEAAQRGCPADVLSLGRGSWRLLHTIAANYPEKPTPSVQQDMRHFITLFSRVYPCPPCAQDFREWLVTHPPEVSSGGSLSQFFCRAHNEVNRKLGKDEFDCSLVDQRWKTGWSDGSCG